MESYRGGTRIPLLGLVMVCTLTACDASRPLRDQDAAQGAANLSGAALAALRPDNTFDLAAAASLNGDRLISQAQAKRLAMAFVRTFGQAFLPTWESDRGGTINLSRIRAGKRAYFAQSPYAALTADGIHQADRRVVGPYYLVTLFDGEEPVIQIAVSALLTKYGVSANGLLESEKQTGMDFITEGIPRNGEFAPVSPEEAAALAAVGTNTTVQTVPQLMLPGFPYSPVLARWKVDLADSIDVGTDARSVQRVRTIFVGPLKRARFAVPSMKDAQRPAVFAIGAGADGGLRRAPASVRAHPGHVAVFERVDLVGRNH